MLKLYYIKLKDDHDWDWCFEQLIIAPSATEARELAKLDTSDTPKEYWTPKYSTCKQVKLTKARVLMRNVKYG